MPLFAFLLFFAAPPQDDPADQLARDLKKLVDVFTIADREAADPVAPDQAFYQGAIPGMLKTLDPHSVFFDPGLSPGTNNVANFGVVSSQGNNPRQMQFGVRFSF